MDENVSETPCLICYFFGIFKFHTKIINDNEIIRKCSMSPRPSQLVVIIVILAIAISLMTTSWSEMFRGSRSNALPPAFARHIAILQHMAKMRKARGTPRGTPRRRIVVPSPPSPLPPMRVFLTGGLSSTYLLCELLLVERRVVHPVYISAHIDHADRKHCRRSIRQEMAAIQKVMDDVRRRFPHAAKRLRPLHIEVTSTVSDNVKRAHRIVFGVDVGQYASIGHWAATQPRPVYLALRLGHRSKNLWRLVREHCVRRRRRIAGNNVQNEYRVPKSQQHTPFGQLFRHIVFRLVDVDNRRFQLTAQQQRFAPVLARTWSCSLPTVDARPCQACLACRDRRELEQFRKK